MKCSDGCSARSAQKTSWTGRSSLQAAPWSSSVVRSGPSKLRWGAEGKQTPPVRSSSEYASQIRRPAEGVPATSAREARCSAGPRIRQGCGCQHLRRPAAPAAPRTASRPHARRSREALHLRFGRYADARANCQGGGSRSGLEEIHYLANSDWRTKCGSADTAHVARRCVSEYGPRSSPSGS